MTATIENLQNVIRDTTTFRLSNYFDISKTFLDYIEKTKPTRIASTFKTNHFLGYTVALNKLDGVYYVDPRPEMSINEKLKEQIRDFQAFLTRDLWVFSK